jgi:hypothetical protein
MYSNLLDSVADVWVIWLASSLIFSLLVFRSFRSQHWRTVAVFLRDERGASYALSYLMTFPFYLMTVCFVIQSTMILIVKIGVMHSAHVAARSAVVWRPAHPDNHQQGLNNARDKARHAAALALAPYASGLEAHRKLYVLRPQSAARLPRAMAEAFAYDELYRKWLAKHSEAKDCLAKPEFVQRKYTYASAMTNLTLSSHANRFNEQLSANVDFLMPIHIPGTGWMLGSWSPVGFYRNVKATATLPLETAETPDGRLGIGYDSSRL